MGVETCSHCDGNLEQGYLLGKHNRIRWSGSPRGMTIFHGVPLIQLEKGFWLKWRNWLYAPNIPATRCPQCKTVTFSYNSEVKENPAGEYRACLFISLVFILIAILTTVLCLLIWMNAVSLPLLLIFGMTIFTLISLFIGLIFLIHAFRIRKDY